MKTLQTRQHTIRLNYPVDLKKWKKLYSEGSSDKIDQCVGETLSAFETFSNAYLKYFDDIINNNVPVEEQFDATQITPERLKERALVALQEYWTPLSKVAEQRQVQHYRELLDAGTENAQQYLDKLQNLSSGKVNLPGVLLYFDKTPMIRYCPYTNLAFIGTPYSMAAKGDWMAIPHEIGHYVYWNLSGTLAGLRLEHQKLRDKVETFLENSMKTQKLETIPREIATQTFLTWLEETFADILGTRLGEQGFIDSLKLLLSSCIGKAQELRANDGSHPVPWLRPFVREYTLKLNKRPFLGIDWFDFFKNIFKVAPPLLFLEIPKQRFKDFLKKRTKQELIKLLTPSQSDLQTSEQPEEIFGPSIRLNFDTVMAIMNPMIECLNNKINELLANGLSQPQSGQSKTAFEELLTLSRAEATFQRKAYEILLRPRILVGSLEHTHACWNAWGEGHFGWVYHSAVTFPCDHYHP